MCHRCRDTELSPMSRDITPGSPGMVSKSDTKGPIHFSPSHTNRGIMRFCQTRSVLGAAFVSDLDTPHLSKALRTPGTTWETVRQRHRCPRSPGSGRDASPRRPVLLVETQCSVGLARH